MTLDWRNTSILITGGTGSFGKKFTGLALRELRPKRLIVLSRDELKQYEMKRSGFDHECLRYFLGDVRDVDRLRRAFEGVDVVVHAAALKQVPACEYNPIEAVMTNVIGARNVIEASLDKGVRRVVALSTDKAVNPVNLYGATKLVSEKLFVQANAYSGAGPTRFACVRYGNVVGSRGSVIPLFRQQREQGEVTITDPRMTRFWLTLDQGVRFVVSAIEAMQGGEVFVPKIPSMNILDLAKALAPDCRVREVGIRAGEKIHETLLSEDESRHALEQDDRYIIQPNFPWWTGAGGEAVPAGFSYCSQSNGDWLNEADLRALCGETSDQVELEAVAS